MPMPPTPPWPDRGEKGHVEGTFLRRLTMVCFVVLVVSGLVVYWIDQTTPPRTANRPPAAGQSSPDTKTHGQQPTRTRGGGVGCDRRA